MKIFFKAYLRQARTGISRWKRTAWEPNASTTRRRCGRSGVAVRWAVYGTPHILFWGAPFLSWLGPPPPAGPYGAPFLCWSPSPPLQYLCCARSRGANSPLSFKESVYRDRDWSHYMYIPWAENIYVFIHIDGHVCSNSNRRLPFIVFRPRKTNFRFHSISS